MITSVQVPDERVADVGFTANALIVSLRDGRIISVPLAWYPRLFNASPAERENWEIIGGGYGIHWPGVDEDLSTEGLLRGAPAPGYEMSGDQISMTDINSLLSGIEDSDRFDDETEARLEEYMRLANLTRNEVIKRVTGLGAFILERHGYKDPRILIDSEEASSRKNLPSRKAMRSAPLYSLSILSSTNLNQTLLHS